jgi:hypothetical protein
VRDAPLSLVDATALFSIKQTEIGCPNVRRVGTVTSMFKKKITMFLLFCAACSPAFGQVESDKGREGFFGPVRSVRTEVVKISYEDGRAHKRKRQVDSIEEFDRLGRTVATSDFSDGRFLSSDRNSFDTSGRLSKTETRYTYLTETPDQNIYTYDPQGNLIKEQGFDANGRLEYTFEYVNDEHGRKVQQTSFTNETEKRPTIDMCTYKYDEKGRVIEEQNFTDEGNGFKPKDNSLGFYKRISIFDNSDHPRFDLSFHADGSFAGFGERRYDRRGNEIENTEYSEDGTLRLKIKYSYMFDQRGNWIRQATYKLTKENPSYRLTEIDYQIIEYFRD